MTSNKEPKKKARSGKVNRFYLGGTYSFLIEIEDIDPAINDDEATLESSDGAYKKTLKVAGDGTKVDASFIHLMFPGVIPGKKYTLTYDMKKDGDGNELGKMVMFDELLIEQKDLNKPEPDDETDESDENEDIPRWEARPYSADLAALYEEPDPDADEDAKLENDQATEDEATQEMDRPDHDDEK